MIILSVYFLWRSNYEGTFKPLKMGKECFQFSPPHHARLYVEILEFDAEYGEGDKLHRPCYVHKSTMQNLSVGTIFIFSNPSLTVYLWLT